MLYPREDKINSTLMFACRSCQYSEPAQASCVYRNSLKEEVAETPGNMMDVAQDPTVGADDDDDLSDPMYDSFTEVETEVKEDVVPDMCTLCGQEIMCPICGQPSENGVVLETADPNAAETAEQEEEQVELEKRERSLSGAGLQNL